MSFGIQSALRTFRSLFQRSVIQETKNQTSERLLHTLLPTCSFSPRLEQRGNQEIFPIPEMLSISDTSESALERHPFVPSLSLSRQYQHHLFLSHIRKRHYSLLSHQTGVWTNFAPKRRKISSKLNLAV